MEQKTLCDIEPEYISHSSVLHRGWTEATIRIFMFAPDKEVPNPYYKNGYPMKLYSLDRIKQIEEKVEFREFQGQTGYRKAASMKAKATKRKKLLEMVNKWKIYINRQNIEDIFTAAIESYNAKFKDHSEDGFPYEPASMKSSRDFINRITVNYLRHQCSSYDNKIIEIKGKVGKKEAFILINQKIYNEIETIYPSLKDECERQLEAKIDKIVKEHL